MNKNIRKAMIPSLYLKNKNELDDHEFVLVKKYIPDIFIELKYAAADNFTGKIIYDFTDAYLRYGTVRKLSDVQNSIRGQGYSLKIWDAFRPVEAQFFLWEVCPNENFVANPNKGFSSHSKGNTVDVTLVNHCGIEILMPTGFDEFSLLTNDAYKNVSKEALKNAFYLKNAMVTHGFDADCDEWWHFSDTTDYPVKDNI